MTGSWPVGLLIDMVIVQVGITVYTWQNHTKLLPDERMSNDEGANAPWEILRVGLYRTLFDVCKLISITHKEGLEL